MKNLIYVILVLCLLGCGKSEDSNNNGGMDSSGGNVSRTNIENAKGMIDYSWARIGYYLRGQHILISDIEANKKEKTPLQQKYSQLFNKMGQEPRQAMETIRLQITEGNCYQKNQIRDASYSNGTICVSATRIALLTSDVLERELLGLLLHELTHHYGFDEYFAENLQRDFIHQYTIFGLNPAVFASAEYVIHNTRWYLRSIRDWKNGKALEEDTCKFSSNLEMNLDKLATSQWVESFSTNIFGHTFASPSFVRAIEQMNTLSFPCKEDQLQDLDISLIEARLQELTKMYRIYLEQVRSSATSDIGI